MSAPMDLSSGSGSVSSSSTSSTLDPIPLTVGVRTRSKDLPTRNIIDLVKREHRLVEQLYAHYLASTDLSIKQNTIHIIIKELSQHSAKEEMVLYPVMKRKLPDGVDLVRHALDEHMGVKIELAAIDSMKLGVDQDLDARLKNCIDQVNHHVSEEESDLLPKLALILTEVELIELGDAFILAGGRAPTRPHPEAPNEGFLAEAANMSAKMEDALKDTARDLTKDSGLIGIAPKTSGDSSVSGQQIEIEPNPSIQMSD